MQQNGPPFKFAGSLAPAGSPRRLARAFAHRTNFSGRQRSDALAFGAQGRVGLLSPGRTRWIAGCQVVVFNFSSSHIY